MIIAKSEHNGDKYQKLYIRIDYSLKRLTIINEGKMGRVLYKRRTNIFTGY